MSQEDPTIVVTPIDSKKFIGGAGIVSSHAVGLGAKVDFFSVVGNDEIGKFCLKKLEEFKVNSTLLVDNTRPTSLKQRFRCEEKTMLRVSHLKQSTISKYLQNELFTKLEKKLKIMIF